MRRPCAMPLCAKLMLLPALLLALLVAGLPDLRQADAQVLPRRFTMVFVNMRPSGNVEVVRWPVIESGLPLQGTPQISTLPLEPDQSAQVTFMESEDSSAIAGTAQFTTPDGTATVTWSWPEEAAQPTVSGSTTGGSQPEISQIATGPQTAAYSILFK